MKKILDSVFLSSAGNGNVSQMWKGLIVVGVAAVFPGTEESEVLAVIEMIVLAAGAVWSAYGAVMKIVRRRWSAPI